MLRFRVLLPYSDGESNYTLWKAGFYVNKCEIDHAALLRRGRLRLVSRIRCRKLPRFR